MKKLVVIGAGGHATSLVESIISSGNEILYFVDSFKSKKKLLGYNIEKQILKDSKKIDIVIGIGDNNKRQEIYLDLLNTIFQINFPIIIHPSASVSRFSKIGKGSVILQNAIVGANSNMGNFCILNSNSSIDHDCKMSNFSSLAPSSVTGGNVKIGLRTAIGINASILHKTNIGNDVVIGSNSYVNKDINNNLVAYGSPARIIRKRKSNSKYL